MTFLLSSLSFLHIVSHINVGGHSQQRTIDGNIICSIRSREGTEGEGGGRGGSGASTRQEAECQLQQGGGPRPPGVLHRAGGFGGRHDGGGGQDGRLRSHVAPPLHLPLLQVGRWVKITG